MVFLRLLPRLAHLPLVSFGSCVCLLAALFLISCSTASTGITHATSTAPTTSTGISSATPIATIVPSPVTTPLAPTRQNCTIQRPPEVQHLDSLGENSNVQLVGGGPFWIYGLFYSNVLHLGQSGSQQWPMTKLVVEVGPNYDQPVTLRLRQIETGALALWTDGQTPPGTAVQTLVLNPRTDAEDVGAVPGQPDVPHGSAGPGWKEWGLFPLFSVAGCYTLEVSWSGGSWQSSFAVGS